MLGNTQIYINYNKMEQFWGREAKIKFKINFISTTLMEVSDVVLQWMSQFLTGSVQWGQTLLRKGHGYYSVQSIAWGWWWSGLVCLQNRWHSSNCEVWKLFSPQRNSKSTPWPKTDCLTERATEIHHSIAFLIGFLNTMRHKDRLNTTWGRWYLKSDCWQYKLVYSQTKFVHDQPIERIHCA